MGGRRRGWEGSRRQGGPRKFCWPYILFVYLNYLWLPKTIHVVSKNFTKFGLLEGIAQLIVVFTKMTRPALKFLAHKGFMMHAECNRTAYVFSSHIQVGF